MTTLTVRIPDELQAELQKFCSKRHQTTSEILRESLRNYLASEELRDIRRKARPYAEAAGYLTDEDVFRDIS